VTTGQHVAEPTTAGDAEALDLGPAPMLRVAGEEFECVAWVPQWSLMRLAKAMSSDEMTGLAGMYDFLQVLVLPKEWARFDAYMSTLDLERSDLDNAIGDVLVEMGGRGKGSADSSGSSSGGSPSPATPAPSRHVSFSRGTVEVIDEGPSLSDAATSSTV
jgi:hypothetical protein